MEEYVNLKGSVITSTQAKKNLHLCNEHQEMEFRCFVCAGETIESQVRVLKREYLRLWQKVQELEKTKTEEERHGMGTKRIRTD